MLKQIISVSVFMVISSIQSLGYADQRYDIFCVTTSNFPKTVFVYDDLIATYAEEYAYKPFTYMKNASVYETAADLPNVLDIDVIEKAQGQRINYINSDFPTAWTENGIQTISGGRAVETTKQKISVRDKNEVRFMFPFVRTTDTSSEMSKQNKVKTGNFIFNGKRVSSVNYQLCGARAD